MWEMKDSNEYLCRRSSSINLMTAMETGNHKKYDYRKNKDKPGVRENIPVKIIDDFIADEGISECTASQFRYLLDLTVAHAEKTKRDASTLYVEGRICTGSNRINHVRLYFISVLEDAYRLIKSKQ